MAYLFEEGTWNDNSFIDLKQLDEVKIIGEWEVNSEFICSWKISNRFGNIKYIY